MGWRRSHLRSARHLRFLSDRFQTDFDAIALGDPSGLESITELQFVVSIAGGLASLAQANQAIFSSLARGDITASQALWQATTAFAGGAASAYISFAFDGGSGAASVPANLVVDAMAGAIGSVITQLGTGDLDWDRVARDATFNAAWSGVFRFGTTLFRTGVHGADVGLLDFAEEEAEKLASESIEQAAAIIEQNMSHLPGWHVTEAGARAAHGFVLGYLKKVVQPSVDNLFGVQKK